MAEVPGSTAPKKRRGFLRGCLIAIGVLIVLAVLGQALGGGRSATSTAPTTVPVAVAAPVPTDAPEPTTAPAPTDAPAPTEAPAAAAILEVGQTGDLDGVKVTLNEVKVVPGTDFFKPDDGKQFVVVDVTFENTTAESENLSTLLMMEMRDDSGQSYGLDLGAISASEGKPPDGALPPGDKLRGQVGYEIPTDAAGLIWIYKSPFGAQRVTFNAQP